MRANEAVLTLPWQTLRFRLLGVLPLLFFVTRAIEYAVIAKTPEQILWSCHVSNLLLAFGMFLANPFLIRVAVFWLILGVPPWIIDMVSSHLITPVSIFSHLGGFIVAIVAIRQVGAKLWSWIPSLIYFVILQQITRLVTAPTDYTNVNVAHFAYNHWVLFSSYWKYWVVNTALAAATRFIIGLVLLWLFPDQDKSTSAS